MSKLVLLTLALTCCAVAHAASVYKWVDEQGSTQYSATPPPYGTPYENLSTPVAPVREQGIGDTRVKEEPVQEKPAAMDREAQWAENCKIAQSNLTTLESDRDIVQTDTDGNKFLLNAEQRQEALRQAQKDIDYYCNP